MGSVRDWQEILAGIRALYDVVKFGSDYAAGFSKYLSEIEVYREAQRVSQMFYTSSGEIWTLKKDIEACGDRITQDKIEDRGRCLCSIFNNIKAGNSGTLPPIAHWKTIYDELGCGSEDMSDRDLREDRPMDTYEQSRADKLSEGELRTIDDRILSHITHEFRKMAKVVALTMGEVGDYFHGLPDVFYSGRIKHLAEAGLIEAAGNLNRMRFSEVRLPNRASGEDAATASGATQLLLPGITRPGD
jgi:hypothetical protein